MKLTFGSASSLLFHFGEDYVCRECGAFGENLFFISVYMLVSVIYNSPFHLCAARALYLFNITAALHTFMSAIPVLECIVFYIKSHIMYIAQ